LTDRQPLSHFVEVQRNISREEDFKTRMKALYPEGKGGVLDQKNGLESLEELEWLAVVHADGNGMGQLFIKLGELLNNLSEGVTGRGYVDSYRNFSAALDDINRKAFKKTVESVWKDKEKADIVPVVVGGDDLTAVMDGKKAIEFAQKFMEAFCSETSKHDAMKNILAKAGLSRLGMCAGITIMKPHFPFAQAYDLAKELMQNAKRVKQYSGVDAIALDFHILYDSVSASIKAIRDKLTFKGESTGDRFLTAKPYVLSQGSGQVNVTVQTPYMTLSQDKHSLTGGLGGASEPASGRTSSAPLSLNVYNADWLALHDIEHFKNAVRALQGANAETGGKFLPSSQSHGVHAALFSEDMGTQEVEWKFLLRKYPAFGELWGKVSKDSALYVSMSRALENGESQNAREHYTYFLDALEAAEFVAGTEESGHGQEE
jgi:hypothetical protein